MKNKLLLTICVSLLIVLMLTLCNCSDKKPTINCNIKVKDITLTNKTDTISYALGIAWGKGLGRNLGFSKISNSFYKGVQDYISGDSSVMGIYKAVDYLDKRQSEIKNDSLWPDNDENISVCDIQVKSKFDTISYVLGYAWCRGAYEFGISKVSPALIIGLSKGLKSDTTLFSYRAADKYLRAYIEELRLKKYADIKKKNEQWLEKNKKNTDVVTTPSGLQYKIIKHGNGISPSSINDIAECNYISKLIDGTVLENTYDKKETSKFYLFAVCKGLAEAVHLMKEGDKWEVYIPYYLADGSGGVRGKVPPYATIIYEVELLKVTKSN